MFCTNCGATITEVQAFCTSCGTSQQGHSVKATTSASSDSEGADTQAASSLELPSQVAPTKAKRASIAISIVVGLLGISIGVAITGAGVAEFAIGVRYTQPELERAVNEADQRGFKRGDNAGYDRGYSEGEDFGYDSGYSAGSNAGYSRGENAGCNSVFDLIGETLIAIRYPWYKLNVYGYRYDRADVC